VNRKIKKQIVGATIQFDSLTKLFGDVTAVDNVSLQIDRGEFLTLLGPSGSGKTTILNMVAGFEKPTQGDILINGSAVGGIPPFKRNIGMVFQNYALFPHMTVFENIAFPLTMRKISQSEIKKSVEEVLALVELQGYGTRYPKQLSGGQQQRVALARSIIFRPPLLLMDEPLGALDKKLREHMQLEIKHLHEELRVTVIYVTHDQSEALTMSDRVVLLNFGKIEQLGKPDELYDQPQNKFVADFIGETNLLEGKIIMREGNIIGVQTLGGVQLRAVFDGNLSKETVSISLRPEKVVLLFNDRQMQNVCSGTLEDVIYVGEITKFKIVLEGKGEEIFVKLQNRKGIPRLSKGDTVRVGWEIDDMTVF
jgi:spermidine/putrescine ABC transporter ATP-binding subunit